MQNSNVSDENIKRAGTCFGVSLLIGILLSFIVVCNAVFSPKGFIQVLSGNLPSESFLKGDIQISGYQVDGNTYTVEDSDCWFLQSAWNEQSVDRITVIFTQPLQQDLTFTVYAAPVGEALGEQHRIDGTLQKGDMQGSITLPQAPAVLRVDIGDTPGQTFVLQDILAQRDMSISGTLGNAKMVAIIAALGVLLGLMVLPLMRKVFYK